MSMLMMGLKGIGAVLLFVLLCPILYTLRLNDRKLAVTVRLFLCVPLRREFDFPVNLKRRRKRWLLRLKWKREKWMMW